MIVLTDKDIVVTIDGYTEIIELNTLLGEKCLALFESKDESSIYNIARSLTPYRELGLFYDSANDKLYSHGEEFNTPLKATILMVMKYSSKRRESNGKDS